MIFHASIPADDPERVARVLGELLGGGYSPFHVGRHSFMARGGADDEYHTGIEVYPRDEVMLPGTDEDEMVRQGHLDNPPRYGCFHLAVGTKLSKDKIIAIGKREGWRALYFSRARVPFGPGPLYHHVGIYAFTRTALARFVALPPSPLEQRERLEQLRALEAGMRIAVARVDAVPLSVDTPEDLAKARSLIR